MIEAKICRNLRCGRFFDPAEADQEYCSPACALKQTSNQTETPPDELEINADYERPRLRGDCMPGAMNPPDEWETTRDEDGRDRVIVTQRQCPFISCRYHVLSEHAVHVARAGKKEEFEKRLALFPFDSLLETTQTCALDLAEAGEQTLDAIADALMIWRCSVEFVQENAVEKLKVTTNRLAKKEGVSLAEILPERETYPDLGPARLDDESGDDYAAEQDRDPDEIDPSEEDRLEPIEIEPLDDDVGGGLDETERLYGERDLVERELDRQQVRLVPPRCQ